MSFITASEGLAFVGSGDLLRVFKIGEDKIPASAFDWSQLNADLIKKPDFEVEKALKNVEKRVILCLAHSNNGSGRRLVAVGTNEKQIHVIEYFVDENGNFSRSRHVVSAVVPKAPTAIVFDKEDAFVVVGDRAGDVHRFSISDGKAVELAGAISMILDVAFTPNGRRLLMADRDEKVRAMRYPETYVIDAYCLGHTEYAKTLAVQDDELVWSAGGDKNLYQWSVEECSKPRQKVDLAEWNLPVRKIALNSQHNKIAVLFEKSDRLLFVHLDQQPAQTSTIQLASEGQYLDAVVADNYFVVLGKSSIMLVDASNMGQSFVPLDDELKTSLDATEDAVDNLFKNVTHNNQAEYEKRKAEKFEQIEQQKKRRLNEPTSA